jgi:hypothetical protein
LVKQSILFGVYIDAQAFSSSLVDVDGVEFASLDLMQHSLAGDPEDLGGVREPYPALRDGGGDPVTDSLVDPDPPRSAGVEQEQRLLSKRANRFTFPSRGRDQGRVNLFAIPGPGRYPRPRLQRAHQTAQRPQTFHIQDRHDRNAWVHPQQVRGLHPDRPRAAIGQLHDEQHHPIDTSEVTSSEQPPEQRMNRRRHSHIARQRRPNVLQSVAITAGTGKSHISRGAGRRHVEAGHRVRYFTAAELVETLYRALADNSVGKVIDTLPRHDLIICTNSASRH